MFPLYIFSQEFSSSFTKVETLRFINKNIKPKGNTGALTSVSTKMDYSENYYDARGIAHYKFDYRSIKITKLGSKVRLSCKSGSCIEYDYKDRVKEETKTLKYLDFEAKSVTELYKAFLHLKKVLGL